MEVDLLAIRPEVPHDPGPNYAGVQKRRLGRTRSEVMAPASRPVFREKPPSCPLLTSTDRRAVAIW